MDFSTEFEEKPASENETGKAIIRPHPPESDEIENDDGGNSLSCHSVDVLKSLYDDVRDLCLLIYGPRRAGKTTLLNQFLPLVKGYYKRVLIFKNTLAEKSSYKGFTVIPLSNKRLNSIIKFAIKANPDESNVKYPILIVFDDVLSSADNSTRLLLDSIAQEGRHFGVSSIFCTQTLTRVVHPTFRDNMDVTILCKPRGRANAFIWDNYFKRSNYEDQFKPLIEAQKKYDKIVINHLTSDVKLCD